MLVEPVLAVVEMEADEALKAANLVACVAVGDTAGDGAPRNPPDVVVTIGERDDVAMGGNCDVVAEMEGESGGVGGSFEAEGANGSLGLGARGCGEAVGGR